MSEPYKQFYLWMEQEGGGCDYTIGCGTKVVLLEDYDPGDRKAVTEKVKEVIEYHGCDLQAAKIVCFVEDALSIYEGIQEDHVQQEEEEDRARKMVEYKRLKRELGV